MREKSYKQKIWINKLRLHLISFQRLNLPIEDYGIINSSLLSEPPLAPFDSFDEYEHP